MLEPEAPYQALLFVSFGGPERPEDVMPFLRNVTKGRGVPEERLIEVAHHYELFGGKSPINEQNRALIEAIRIELDRRRIRLPVYFGNRNWHPFLEASLKQMADDKVVKALAFVTSAFSSYSGCRQYREDIQAARNRLGKGAAEVDKIRVFYNHPGFVTAVAERLKEKLALWSQPDRSTVEVVFTAHSVPKAMASRSDYVVQLNDAANLVIQNLKLSNPWRLAFQSRSGPPQTPWLEPDILHVLRELHDERKRDAVVAPLGFLTDHVEVLYDLDVEAKTLATSLGIRLERAGTVGTHPVFVSAVVDLIEERLDPSRPKLFWGDRGPKEDVCPADCCLATSGPRPNHPAFPNTSQELS